jgi:hypothetical protein
MPDWAAGTKVPTQLRESRRHFHEVSPSGVATGNGMQGRARSTARGRRISTGRMRLSLQSGQRSGGLGCCCLVPAAAPTLGDGASSSVRYKQIFSWRPRLARKPKCRIFTKPRGSTWSRKRRMNSVACSVRVSSTATISKNTRLGKAERLILETLTRVYPGGLNKEEVAARAGYEANGGGFNEEKALRLHAWDRSYIMLM